MKAEKMLRALLPDAVTKGLHGEIPSRRKRVADCGIGDGCKPHSQRRGYRGPPNGFADLSNGD